MQNTPDITRDEILDRIQAGDWTGLEDVIPAMHPADIAEMLDELSADATVAIFKLLPLPVASEVFDETKSVTRQQLIHYLDDESLADILDALPMDDAVEALEQLPEDDAARLFLAMRPDRAMAVERLMHYEPDTAGRLMRTDYAALHCDWTAKQARGYLRSVRAETPIYSLYVIDEMRQLVGVVRSRTLLLAEAQDLVRELMTTEVVSVLPTTDQEEMAQIIAKYDIVVIPVIDRMKRLLGVVTVDDVIDVIEEEFTEDIQRLGGSAPLDRPYFATPSTSLFQKRIGWLLLLFLGGALTSFVTDAYQEVWIRFAALAAFVPLIIGTGGNTGSQTVATIIRGISVGEIDVSNVLRVWRKELSTGLLLGAAMCLLGFFLVATFFGIDPHIAVSVSVTLLLVILWASTMGTLIPLTAERIGLDPAVVSGPMISTLVDVTGLIIYYTLAGLIMGVF